MDFQGILEYDYVKAIKDMRLKSIRDIGVSAKIFFPIISGFILLVLTFVMLISNLGKEREMMLKNIDSTKQLINLSDRLAELEEQTEQEAASYRLGADKAHLQNIQNNDAETEKLVAEMRPYLKTQQGRDLAQAYITSLNDTSSFRQQLLAAVESGKQDRIQRAYDDWESKTKDIDSALSGISAYSASLLDQDIAAFKSVFTEVIVTYVAILLVTVVLILLLYYYLRNLIVAPIRRLTAGAKKITEENFNWDTHISRNDEVGKLEQAFREMTKKLRDSYATLHDLAFHDALTNLPNRQSLEKHLETAKDSVKRQGQVLGVMLMDLDRFKKINDSLGHDIGDMVLKEVAARLLSVLRSQDVVLRLGGDEFVILLSGADSAAAVAVAANKILRMLEQTLALGGRQLHITGSIGVALYPSDGESVSALLKNADIALYEAKASGRNRFNFYSKVADLQLPAQLELEDDLRSALDKDQLKILYQPIINISSNKVTAIEALLRWQHPSLGLLLPHEFIPLAEETGAISRLGEWVFKTACAQAVQWQEAGLSDFQISINLSPRQFSDDGLVQNLTRCLEQTTLQPNRLILEITESVAMANLEQTREKLKMFRDKGICISIDDFGIGYSSLSSLKDFAVNKIKIDSSFVRHIITDPQDTAIVKAVVTMGHNLNLSVTAEGVESDTQLALLRSLNCDEAQGYFISRPLAAEDMAVWLKSKLPKLQTPAIPEKAPTDGTGQEKDQALVS